ncbi:hypothetical protein K438DRAFT_1440591, partial [Mycena galopus ATCC 62051]
SFPPAPASDDLRESIIRDFCDDFDPFNFIETGCAVCGRLTPKKRLTNKDDLMLDWDILVPEECTVQERFNVDDAVECTSGPVLADGFTDVCVECEGSLHRGRVPLHSLANHLWLGAVPWQLQDLTFAEQMLISKVRHNHCVVRVASGRGKLVGNAIMFSTP